MTTLQGGAHCLHVADAFKRVVDAAIGYIDDHFLNRPAVIAGVDEFRRSQELGHLEFLRIEIDSDDPLSLGQDQTLNHAQTDATQVKHDCRGAGSHFGGIQNGPDASRDPTAKQTSFFQRRRRIDFG